MPAARPRSSAIGVRLLVAALLCGHAGGRLVAQSRGGPDPEPRQRLRAYATQYLATMTSVVAHEHYVQNISERRTPPRSVVLRSDVLMLHAPGSAEPVWFRDVYEVDGRPVRDRDDRLLRLLESKAPGSIDAMRKIAAESARFNLGRVPRTTNVPDLIFAYLVAPPERVTLTSPKDVTLTGQRVTMWRFAEVGTPTSVRSALGRDTPGRGRLWVEPATGVVVRSEVILGDVSSSVTTTVDFVPHPRLPVRVPGRMNETYRTPDEFGTGTATYTDVRIFGVTTSEQVKKPPVIASGPRMRPRFSARGRTCWCARCSTSPLRRRRRLASATTSPCRPPARRRRSRQ